MATILEIRQEKSTTSIACRVKIDNFTLEWLLHIADIRKTSVAAVAASVLKMLAEDDMTAHGEPVVLTHDGSMTVQ